MRRNRSNAHRTGDVRSTGNERLGSRDDLEHAVMGEIAYEEPFEACGGEKLLLDMEVVEKKNGEMLDLRKRNAVRLKILIFLFDGGSSGMKETKNEQASKQTRIWEQERECSGENQPIGLL